MRLFVAAYPSPAAAEHLSGTVAGLVVANPPVPGRATGLIPSQRWHLTMAFLGEVPDGRGPDAQAALGAAVDGWAEAPRLRLAGGGHFGRGRFTVMWVGVRGDLPALRTLVRAVGRSLRQARLPVDRKPFRPHLTLARCGDRLTADQVRADLAVLDRYEGPGWTLSELHLVRSALGPRPEYRTLARVPVA